MAHLADERHVFVFAFFTDAHKLLWDQSLALETLLCEIFLCHFLLLLLYVLY